MQNALANGLKQKDPPANKNDRYIWTSQASLDEVIQRSVADLRLQWQRQIRNNLAKLTMKRGKSSPVEKFSINKTIQTRSCSYSFSCGPIPADFSASFTV